MWMCAIKSQAFARLGFGPDVTNNLSDPYLFLWQKVLEQQEKYLDAEGGLPDTVIWPPYSQLGVEAFLFPAVKGE